MRGRDDPFTVTPVNDPPVAVERSVDERGRRGRRRRAGERHRRGRRHPGRGVLHAAGRRARAPSPWPALAPSRYAPDCRRHWHRHPFDSSLADGNGRLRHRRGHRDGHDRAAARDPRWHLHRGQQRSRQPRLHRPAHRLEHDCRLRDADDGERDGHRRRRLPGDDRNRDDPARGHLCHRPRAGPRRPARRARRDLHRHALGTERRHDRRRHRDGDDRRR